MTVIPSVEGADEREARDKPSYRQHDRRADVTSRSADPAFFIEQDSLQREGRESREATHQAGGEEKPPRLRAAAPEGRRP